MNLSILISLAGIVLFAVFAMASYYLGMPRFESVLPDLVKGVVGNPEASGFAAYIIAILLPLVSYLGVKVWMESRRISTSAVTGYFFWVVLITAWMTFAHIESNTMGTAGQRLSFGFSLFGQVLKYLLFLIPLAIVFVGSGRLLLEKIGIYESIPESLRFPLSMGIGWSALVIKLAVIGFFGWYNIWIFYGLVTITAIASYRTIWESIREFYVWSFEMGNRNQDILRLTVNSMLLVTLLIVVSTNLVNIVRPYPIGWDDLGVYMNFPKLLALSESTSNLGMVFWQTFTGIGFMHKSATLAFFLNQFGTVLAVCGIWAGIRYFTMSKNHPLVSLPLLATTIFM